jgi:hypothetical protein
MKPCNYIMYLFVYVLYINFRKSFVCIHLIACCSKNLCGIAQLDVGYVTICSAERTRAFSRVAWPGHECSGTLQHGIKTSVFNTEPRWADQVNLKKISQRIYFKVAKFQVTERPW